MLFRSDLHVRPQIYPRLHPMIKKLTGLSMELLQNAPLFPDAFHQFLDFAGFNPTFCTWGDYDIEAFMTNMLFYGLDAGLFPNRYVNVQDAATSFFKLPSNTAIGLRSAVEKLNILIGESFHNALNDAAYTAKIFASIRTGDEPVKTFDLERLFQKLWQTEHPTNIVKLNEYAERLFKCRLSNRQKSAVLKIYRAGTGNTFAEEQ